MTGNFSSKISEELLREIRKLEIRFDYFLKDEEAFCKRVEEVCQTWRMLAIGSRN